MVFLKILPGVNMQAGFPRAGHISKVLTICKLRTCNPHKVVHTLQRAHVHKKFVVTAQGCSNHAVRFL